MDYSGTLFSTDSKTIDITVKLNEDSSEPGFLIDSISTTPTSIKVKLTDGTNDINEGFVIEY